jgi:threonylcarbamoyladenosine tRNA methylthiotransferase MtaB
MSAVRTCRLVTLGCKVNQYETQHVKEMLEANGYREALAEETADLCVVNTCTVTHEADAKGRQLIRRLAEANPGAALIVMGCYATREPDTVRRLPGVTLVITDKARLGEELRPFGISRVPSGITRFDGHRRAFVKVQDGCLLHCSFCIIPTVRSIVRSRPLDEVVAEVAQLVSGGCREIVLTGIHLGHYGIDLSRGKPKSAWCRLWHLVRELDRLPGDFRIRLSSLEAAEVRGELVEAVASSRRVCPHLHVCLQSGSDRILTAMRRRYRAASFLERCRWLREILDRPALTTDAIIGFPGETEEDFRATCRVAEQAGFSKIHIFSYSPRSGTPAASLPERVPAPVIAERRARLLELERQMTQRYLDGLVGRSIDVLVEGPDPIRMGHAQGTSCRYFPTSFPGLASALLAKRVPVRAAGVRNGTLIALPEPEDFRADSVPQHRKPLPILDALC